MNQQFLPMGDEAIYALYPQVVSINNGNQPYDAQGNLVVVDWDLVTAKNDELILQGQLENCKKQASALLFDTDWTTIPDITDPTNTPYLTNQNEFLAYRNALRKLAVNPVANPVFPTKPTAVWSN